MNKISELENDGSYSLSFALDRLRNSLKSLLEENKSYGNPSRLIQPMQTIMLPDRPGRRFRTTLILENGNPDLIAIEDYTDVRTKDIEWDELSLADKEAVLKDIEGNGLLG
jgi:hypothetical protein